MGENRYTRAKALLEELKEKNGDTIPFSLLRMEIMKKIGADKRRTMRPYLALMFDLNMITKTEDDLNVVIR